MSGLYNKMLDELRQEMDDQTRKPDEFTSKEFYESLAPATKSDASLQAIRCRLGRMVENGEMETRRATVDGKSTTLYRFVDNKKAPEGASSDE